MYAAMSMKSTDKKIHKILASVVTHLKALGNLVCQRESLVAAQMSLRGSTDCVQVSVEEGIIDSIGEPAVLTSSSWSASPCNTPCGCLGLFRREANSNGSSFLISLSLSSIETDINDLLSALGGLLEDAEAATKAIGSLMPCDAEDEDSVQCYRRLSHVVLTIKKLILTTLRYDLGPIGSVNDGPLGSAASLLSADLILSTDGHSVVDRDVASTSIGETLQEIADYIDTKLTYRAL
eukprot:Tbor_TRINITY_DN2567_c0_g1::TRINITY_DN2567_c0_g1_i1::g.482::m.482